MSERATSSRYQRQIILPEIGLAGQQRLLAAKVLVIGAGGLGCPALQYLAAAGIGNIAIVDGDTIDMSNLHRQTLFSTADVGKLKAITAKQKLLQLNPDCNVTAYPFFLGKHNATAIIAACDIVLDGSDNFNTRYLVNDACVLLKKTLVYGAIYRFEGQVAVFNHLLKNGSYSAQYRDLFPTPPLFGTIPNCAEAGVLGVLPGIIGTMQANEVIKLITGIGQPLINKLLTYNALNNQTYQLAFQPTEKGRIATPADRETLEQTDYEFDCTFGSKTSVISIGAVEFDALISRENITIIDVREKGELPHITAFKHLQIPLSVFSENAISTANDIVLFCQSGLRSRKAAALLSRKNSVTTVYSVEGGINAWLLYKQKLV